MHLLFSTILNQLFITSRKNRAGFTRHLAGFLGRNPSSRFMLGSSDGRSWVEELEGRFPIR